MAGIIITCERCGDSFIVKPYRGPNGSRPAKWCSKQCTRNTSPVFWDNVIMNSAGCWEWKGSRHNAGYGLFGPKRERAHRMSYEMAYGPIPANLWVLHHCDNPQYVRPDHLFAGTPQDNTADMISKNRDGFSHQKGEASSRAKLKDAAIPEIRRRRANGETLTAIGRSFHVSPGAILHIVNRATWKHIT